MKKNEALMQVVLERFVNRRLPRIMDIKKKINNGGALDELDIKFMTKVISDNKQNKHLFNDNKELQNILNKAIHLYNEIIEMAIQNEKNKT